MRRVQSKRGLQMRYNTRTVRVAVSVFVLFAAVSLGSQAQNSGSNWSPTVPRTWDDEAVQSLELPLATPSASPKHISSDYYYRMLVRPIYKSYPVYRPDKEPAGYLDSLKKQTPEIAFDSSTLKTKEDWIKAGEMVFDAPIEFESSGTLYTEIRGTAWFDTNHVPTTKAGILPFIRYVVREKGKVELGLLSC